MTSSRASETEDEAEVEALDEEHLFDYFALIDHNLAIENLPLADRVTRAALGFVSRFVLPVRTHDDQTVENPGSSQQFMLEPWLRMVYQAAQGWYRDRYRPALDRRDRAAVGLVLIYGLYVVLVWRYDRFARSTVALVNALTEFRSLGVDFVSLQEHLDSTRPQGELIFSIMASLAQFESSLISDRVKARMANARAKGKQIGRA
jgi:hypothetical protein